MSATLLRGARLVGGDGTPTDVLIGGGVVEAMGAVANASWTSAAAERIDLDGRWVGTGLWDHHVHFGQWSLMRRRVDVGAAGSAAEARAIVAARLADDPPPAGEALVGYGFRDALWPDAPTAELLEFGAVPVVLVSGDLHCVWLNRAAAAALGLALGDGVLREQPAFEANARLSRVPDERLDAWAAEAAAAAAARGVVGIVDLEMGGAATAWARRGAARAGTLRVRAGVYPHDLDDAVAHGWRTGTPLDGDGGLVEVGPFKIITDGSLNTRTAFCHDPYPGLDGDAARGMSTVAPDELRALVRRVADLGFRTAVHAIGDAANAWALDAYEATGVAGSIEHAQLLDDDDLARFARLGVVASVQPEHAMDDRDVADRLWPGRTGRAYAWRSLAEAGARLAFGSDAPVAPLDPWSTMAAAVSRTRDGREPWHPEQRLDALAAYLASTDAWGPAPRRPAPGAGDLADLVVLDANPLSVGGEALRAMSVAGTMVAGEWTHRAL